MPVRVHSERLNRGMQLGHYAAIAGINWKRRLKTIGEMENGILLYLRQEGRGIGLNQWKSGHMAITRGLAAMISVEANLALGFRDDEREYSSAAHMLDLIESEIHPVDDQQSEEDQ
ncbi:MAG: hypothetical protein M0C28_30555 [Candidatus Moduliflexus flocculans]|nr:hypothetical protein [Candidatus Moduliflexus flocculans]